jgi:hypothetical protein
MKGPQGWGVPGHRAERLSPLYLASVLEYTCLASGNRPIHPWMFESVVQRGSLPLFLRDEPEQLPGLQPASYARMGRSGNPYYE